MTDVGSIVRARDLRVSFGRTEVLHGVDLDVAPGSAVGLVGESGSGKSTLAKVLVGSVAPTSGVVRVAGIDVGAADRASRRRLHRSVQLIPQDPYSSLNPRRTIGQALAEAIDPVRPSVRGSRARIDELLDRVRIPRDAVGRHPHEFSGGQRQRIAIARGLAVEPRVLVADEVTSALDVSVQAEVLRLLAELRRDLGLTMLFISHNLAVVNVVCDEVAVMRAGDVVESGSVREVFAAPRHPYTRELLASVPGSPDFTLETALERIH